MSNPTRLTRRQAIGMFGVGAAGALVTRVLGETTEFPKGAIIRTVLKDLRPEALAGGATLFHEHLSLAPGFLPRFLALSGRTPPQTPQNASASANSMQDLGVMSEEMKAAAKEGVASIVDGGHEDMGRDLNFLKQLSMRSGMPIIAGCGYYTQPFYPPEIATMSEDQIAEDLVHKANSQPVGAFGEIGTWDEMTGDEHKVFRAVAKAHIETNLPIFTHTSFGKGALEQLDLLESAGVKPQRIAIGHVGGLEDPKAEVVKAISKRGAYAGFDRQGGPADARNISQVLALIEAGYARNLLFSSDLAAAQQLKRNGGPGYSKTLTVFVPKLREAGVKDETLHSILVDNSRRFLAFVPKKRRKG